MPDFVIPQDPTNHDIMLILVQMNSKLESVEKQAIKTNGRVNSIEEWKTGLQAVAAFQEKHPAGQNISAPNATTVQVMQPTKWFQSEKLVAGVVAVLLGIAAVLGIWAQGGGQ